MFAHHASVVLLFSLVAITHASPSDPRDPTLSHLHMQMAGQRGMSVLSSVATHAPSAIVQPFAGIAGGVKSLAKDRDPTMAAIKVVKGFYDGGHNAYRTVARPIQHGAEAAKSVGLAVVNAGRRGATSKPYQDSERASRKALAYRRQDHKEKEIKKVKENFTL